MRQTSLEKPRSLAEAVDQLHIISGNKPMPLNGAPDTIDEWVQLFNESQDTLQKARDESARVASRRRYEATQTEMLAAQQMVNFQDLPRGWRFDHEQDECASNLVALFPPAGLDTHGVYLRARVTDDGDALALWASNGAGRTWTIGKGIGAHQLHEVISWCLVPALEREAADQVSHA